MDNLGKLNYRWNMIKYAQREGISQAARVYGTTRKTVRKWIEQYLEAGVKGLENKSRIKQKFPHKMPKRLENKIIELRKKYPFWGCKKEQRTFQKLQVDIKYLTDIPEIIGDFRFHKLPKYQITARDYKTGYQCIGFSYEKSSTCAGIYVDYLCQKLSEAGTDISETTFQTDNGAEFVSNSKKKNIPV